ncbi:5-formyltetrahydrofolate cyclo-ligase [Halovivax asiaticus JCM 14624]|uniref:5-formyltetrahydrofolate cyclo-ligase n=1 Tax=Halovivax asiaticus JCM 14624 TaxID=1227490 RepID=M0BNX7_9EURY|nr:5-formyltetrahydrofolate cyclo-ligase [Halovivax asiaticus]ELZ12192.1 5-formyltetrahydrofolate cyclo-ligase [Halovivax asiaticus JCM 14624]
MPSDTTDSATDDGDEASETSADVDGDRAPEKDAIRECVWDALEAEGVARFPFPPHGRIPNVAGASEAAARLADQPEWRDAATIKANPDAPQLPVRRRALRDGKRLLVAVPRLRSDAPFLELDPAVIDDYDAATTVSGISEYGTPVTVDSLPGIDLIVSGSVAVTTAGDRIGKGEGYSDLEYAILVEHDCVDADTPVATTVHERQLVDAIDAAPHDVGLSLLVTPDRTVRPETVSRPDGLDWDRLSADRIEEIPVLSQLQP